VQLVAQADATVQLPIARRLEPSKQPRRDLRGSLRGINQRLELGFAELGKRGLVRAPDAEYRNSPAAFPTRDARLTGILACCRGDDR